MTDVDFAAVAHERDAMADTARLYPELLTPDARERCERYLEGEHVKRLDPDSDKSIQLGIRIPASLLTAIDAEVSRLNSLAPGVSFNRSDAVRSILTSTLRPVAPGTPAPPSRLAKGGLLERFKVARDKKLTSNVKAGKAIDSNEARLRRWADGKATLTAEMEIALSGHLHSLGA